MALNPDRGKFTQPGLRPQDRSLLGRTIRPYQVPENYVNGDHQTREALYGDRADADRVAKSDEHYRRTRGVSGITRDQPRLWAPMRTPDKVYASSYNLVKSDDPNSVFANVKGPVKGGSGVVWQLFILFERQLLDTSIGSLTVFGKSKLATFTGNSTGTLLNFEDQVGAITVSQIDVPWNKDTLTWNNKPSGAGAGSGGQGSIAQATFVGTDPFAVVTIAAGGDADILFPFCSIGLGFGLGRCVGLRVSAGSTGSVGPMDLVNIDEIGDIVIYMGTSYA